MPCALLVIMNDLPWANFCWAIVSAWVKLSGSISPWEYIVLRSASISRYCDMAPVSTNFPAAASQYAPWFGDWYPPPAVGTLYSSDSG